MSKLFLTGIVLTLGLQSVQAIAQSTFTLNARLTFCRNEFHRLITYRMIKNMLPSSELREGKKRKRSNAISQKRERGQGRNGVHSPALGLPQEGEMCGSLLTDLVGQDVVVQVVTVLGYKSCKSLQRRVLGSPCCYCSAKGSCLTANPGLKEPWTLVAHTWPPEWLPWCHQCYNFTQN